MTAREPTGATQFCARSENDPKSRDQDFPMHLARKRCDCGGHPKIAAYGRINVDRPRSKERIADDSLFDIETTRRSNDVPFHAAVDPNLGAGHVHITRHIFFYCAVRAVTGERQHSHARCQCQTPDTAGVESHRFILVIRRLCRLLRRNVIVPGRFYGKPGN